MNKLRSFTGMSIVLSIVFVLTACGSAQAELVRSETSNKGLEIPVFEIWIEKDGSVPIRGKSLLLRMFEDGNIEFDYEIGEDYLEDGIKKRVDYSVKRIPRKRISEKQYERFSANLDRVLENDELKSEYERVGIVFDTSARITIIVYENGRAGKTIVLNDGDRIVVEKSAEGVFPDSIVDLIKQVHEIRIENTL